MYDLAISRYQWLKQNQYREGRAVENSITNFSCVQKVTVISKFTTTGQNIVFNFGLRDIVQEDNTEV